MPQKQYFFFSACVVSAFVVPPAPVLHARTLGLHSFSQLPSAPAALPTSLLPSGSTRNISSLQSDGASNIPLLFDVPECRTEYGQDMNKESCLNAWESIPIDLHSRTYGRRHEGAFDYPLPQRYLSGTYCFLGDHEGGFKTLIQTSRRRSLRFRHRSSEEGYSRNYVQCSNFGCCTYSLPMVCAAGHSTKDF